jgi:hypothetical protein
MYIYDSDCKLQIVCDHVFQSHVCLLSFSENLVVRRDVSLKDGGAGSNFAARNPQSKEGP